MKAPPADAGAFVLPVEATAFLWEVVPRVSLSPAFSLKGEGAVCAG